MEYATWMSELGLDAYVLRHRVRNDGFFWPAPLEDFKCAFEMIKSDYQSEENSMLRLAGLARLEIMIGVMGFSSGGHLASYAPAVLLEHKPVFQILVYPSTDVETPPHDPWRARLGYPGPETNTFKLASRKRAANVDRNEHRGHDHHVRVERAAVRRCVRSAWSPMREDFETYGEAWARPGEGMESRVRGVDGQARLV